MATPTGSGSPAAAPNCPSCGAAIAVGMKFCSQCGAPVLPVASATTNVPATIPSPGAPPVDIRQRVDQDRGTLKRLQLLIPGFRGYRQGEDIRESDSILRLQVASRVHSAVTTIQNVRAQLTQSNMFQALTDLAPVLSDLLRLEGEIRNAEQGYTGISPAVRATVNVLDKLYEYDYGFVGAADQVTRTLAPLAGLATQGNAAGLAQLTSTVRTEVAQLEQTFRARLQVVEGIQV